MAQSMHLHHFCCEMQLPKMVVLCCVSVRLFCIFAVTCRATLSGAGLFLYQINKFISLFLELYLSRSRGNCIFICVVFRHLTAANKCCGTCFFNLQQFYLDVPMISVLLSLLSLKFPNSSLHINFVSGAFKFYKLVRFNVSTKCSSEWFPVVGELYASDDFHHAVTLFFRYHQGCVRSLPLNHD